LGGAATPSLPPERAAPWLVEIAGEVRTPGAVLTDRPDDFVAAGVALRLGAFAAAACLVVDFVLSAGALAATFAVAVDFDPAPAGFGVVAATLAGVGSLAAVLSVDLAGALAAAGLEALACPLALVEALALSATGLALSATGLALSATGLALSATRLAALWPDDTAGFAGALDATAWTAFFAAATLVAARAEASVAAPAFFDDSFAVLAVPAFADAFVAFAFTTAPFFVSAASMFVGTISLSCHGEGDRR
jgi:hypothetical protein